MKTNNHKMTKSVVILMCALLMLGLFTITAMAAEIVDSGECGDNLTWTLTDDGTLTISGEGDMKEYEVAESSGCRGQVETEWNNEKIVTVIIENGITSIDNNVLGNCPNLTSIYLPASIRDISAEAIKCPDSLREIVVDENNPSYCHENGALYNKNKTVLIAVPKALSGNFIVPYGVTTIGKEAFFGCGKLEEILLPDSVATIGDYAFALCGGLDKIALPDSITIIGAHSFYCSELTEIKLPQELTEIGDNAFDSCRNLKKMKLPDGLTIIGDYAFKDCGSLTDIRIPKSVTDIGSGVFVGCVDLKKVAIDKDNPVYSYKNGALLDKEEKTLIEAPCDRKKYTVPSSVTNVAQGAFVNCYYMHETEIGIFPTEVKFKGNAPVFGYGEMFRCSENIVYYPENAQGWDKVMEKYSVDDNVTWIPYTPISTLGWICIAAAGVVVLGGIGFGTYKLIKKRKSAKTEDSDN